MSDFGKIYAKRLFAPDRNETLTLMFVPIDLLNKILKKSRLNALEGSELYL